MALTLCFRTPYNKDILPGFMQALLTEEILAPEAIIIVETSIKEAENIKANGFNGCKIIKDSKYGDTAVIYFARERSAGCGQS